MAHVATKIDLTANLPDELLHHVFGYLALRDKLRVEAVSHRFQRCVQEQMKIQPQPLVMNTDTTGHLNGYRIQPSQVYDALRALAAKSKFTTVSIRIPDPDAQNWKFFDGGRPHMNSLLSILSEAECLDEVVSFDCPYCPNEDILKKFISKCVKLSALALHFTVSPPSVASPFWLKSWVISSNIHLGSILRDKPLTEIDLELAFYPQSQLIKLFRFPRLRTLQKLGLLIYEMRELDFAAVVKKLSSTNAWSALREMKIGFTKFARINVASFIQSLEHLPALNKCDIVSHDRFDVIMDGDDEVDPTNQFEAAAMALFDVNRSNVKVTITSVEGCAFLRSDEILADCQVMAQIRRIQSKIPRIAVNFYCKPENPNPENHDPQEGSYNTLFLSLSNENGLFEEHWGDNQSCGDVDCAECHRFYPRVFSHLAFSEKYTDMHLEKYRLDKCRVDAVVEHLNASRVADCWKSAPKALSAELNETGDLATISFDGGEDQGKAIDSFKITLGCGPCFSRSCIRCVDVE